MNNLIDIYKLGKNFILENQKEDNKINDFYIIFESIFNIKRYELNFIENKNKIIEDKLKIDIFFNMLKDIIDGKPLGYVLGYQEFCGLNFKVGPGVFIPRNDTEVLINLVSSYIIKNKNINKKNGIKIIDLCAGSGTIALTLKKRFINCNIIAIEKHKAAFKYLTKNTKSNNFNITLLHGSIFSFYEKFIDNEFDFIISNPPYIPTKKIKTLSVEVQQEPLTALDGDFDGLFFYKNILKYWTSKLKQNGIMAFELGINQSYEVFNLLKLSGFKNIVIKKDLNNIDRAILGQL